MVRKISKSKLPKTSCITNFITTTNYEDTYAVALQKPEISIESIYLNIFAYSPQWITNLLEIRNKAVKPFGLKTDSKKLIKENLKVGEKTGIFNIYAITGNEIVAGDNDAHLNYRVSVLKNDKTLTVSTLVQYNNWFGKGYFFIVKPFHKAVINSILKNAVTNNRI